MTAPDLVEQAMAIIDNTTSLLPERAHLVALHRHHRIIIRRQEARLVELLKILDREHSHVEPCPCCQWLAGQPEWDAIQAEALDEEFGSL